MLCINFLNVLFFKTFLDSTAHIHLSGLIETWRHNQDPDELVLGVFGGGSLCPIQVEMSRSNRISELGAQKKTLAGNCMSGSHWLCVEAMGMSDPVRGSRAQKECEFGNRDWGRAALGRNGKRELLNISFLELQKGSSLCSMNQLVRSLKTPSPIIDVCVCVCVWCVIYFT